MIAHNMHLFCAACTARRTGVRQTLLDLSASQQPAAGPAAPAARTQPAPRNPRPPARRSAKRTAEVIEHSSEEGEEGDGPAFMDEDMDDDSDVKAVAPPPRRTPARASSRRAPPLQMTTTPNARAGRSPHAAAAVDEVSILPTPAASMVGTQGTLQPTPMTAGKRRLPGVFGGHREGNPAQRRANLFGDRRNNIGC